MAELYSGKVVCGACERVLVQDTDGQARCACGQRLRVFRFRPFRKEVPAAAFVPGSGAPCAYHAGNTAVAPCARCGSFLCDLCVTPIQGKTYCPACFEQLHTKGELASLKHHYDRPHATALVVGLFCFIPFFGILLIPIVLWKGVQALKKRPELAEREWGVGFYCVLAFLFSLLGILISLAIILSALK